MADLSNDIFTGDFDIPATFKTDKDATAIDVRAIIYEGFEPGRESGKGLTSQMRGVQAGWVTIILKQSEVADKPKVHSFVNDGSEDFDIQSADNTRTGTWRCKAKRNVRAVRRK
jgi:hypothetical protein